MKIDGAVLESGGAALATMSAVISLGCPYYTTKPIHNQVTIICIRL
ncbi:MAG: hypothetical protein QM730_20015 [Anaerolineales bacterium]